MDRPGIMIVEDEALVARDLGEVLEKLGYHVVGTAYTGEDALLKVRAAPPDLVLMDIMLGGTIDGIDTARAIRDNPGTPVVFLTAHSNEDTVERALHTNPYGYILKPFNHRELQIVLTMALNRISLEKELEDYRKSLEEQRELYRQLVEYANDMIIRTDRRGVINYINSAAERISGYGHDEMIGKRYLDFVHPDHREQQRQNYREQINDGRPTAYYELPLIAKDGTDLWVGQTLTIIRENGEVTGYHSIARNVTDQKLLEKALVKSESHFRMLIENSTDLISIITSDGVILYKSPSIRRIMDYNETDLVGENIFDHVHPNDVSVVSMALSEVKMKGLETFPRIEYRFRHRNGNWKDLESQGLVILDKEKMVSAIILNSRDITERKTAEKMVQEHNMRLVETNRRLEHIYEISKALSSSIELNSMLESLLQAVLRIEKFNLDGKGAIFIKEGKQLIPACMIGLDDSFLEAHEDLTVGQCLCGKTAESLELIIAGPESEYSAYKYLVPEPHKHGSINVPLISVDVLVGVLCVFTRGTPGINRDDHRILSSIGSQAGIAITNARRFEETKFLSLRDHLTGAYNRRSLQSDLERRIEEVKRYEKPLSVIMMDIDHFKRYNDTHGHTAGDELLKQVTAGMLAELRKTDTLYRYGGEEFIVVLVETPLKEASHVAERLRASVEGHTGVTISLGVAAADRKYQTGEDLVGAADRALYRAKEGGRNQVEIEP